MAGERGEGSVFTGEPGEGGVGVSEWWPAPMKQWSKCQNVLKDVRESKAGRLEDAAAAVDTSDVSQERKLYPAKM